MFISRGKMSRKKNKDRYTYNSRIGSKQCMYELCVCACVYF
jgi:hypothetical protein